MSAGCEVRMHPGCDGTGRTYILTPRGNLVKPVHLLVWFWETGRKLENPEESLLDT